jgi:hypothetical protein
MKEIINKALALPTRLIAKLKDAFAHKEGKMILKMGTTLTNSGSGNPLVLTKMHSNRWTRFKRLVMFPFNYVWHGSAKL